MNRDREQHTESTALTTFAFRAMNTAVSCTLSCEHKEQAEQWKQTVMSWFRYIENRFSRFRPGSELVQLNKTTGTDCLVSSAMLEVLQLTELYRKQTEGTFSPFILDALQRCGYDRSFEQLTAASGAAAALSPAAHFASADSAIDIDAPAIQINSYMQSVKLPSGAAIDLGGIVKGWAVRRLADWLRRKHGVARGILNAGGDLAVWGGGPLGSNESPVSSGTEEITDIGTRATAETSACNAPAAYAASPIPAARTKPDNSMNDSSPLWRIAIEHPWQDEGTIGLLLLGDGASATSSTLGRRWEQGGEMMHHLIDPVTLRPAASDLVQCTTSGSDPVACEIWAKTLCILGSEAGLGLLARAKPPVEALLFSRGRDIIYYGDQASLGAKWVGVPVTRTIFRNA
ncbi:FAD:protein FMN transferase [Paenibacillus rhizovicinus]|uniref:FAD:protein FMN transferase n=1 Tax=Paenibacillus rhizovicinus TaxID=2704463 RepID=A0A6C0P1R6_9BACL|nr:FAD:protein FMN transferase [Paenibacillus rhizovicinus]QHW32428.1 FAD:protein FMN transferase [Paenibacillus rhizovicinus]